MSKTKYINIKSLKKNILRVLDEVENTGVVYIIMQDNAPRAKLTAFNGKKVITEKQDYKKLEKFIKD